MSDLISIPASAHSGLADIRTRFCPWVAPGALIVMCQHYFIAREWADGETQGVGTPVARAWLAVAEQCAAFLQYIGHEDFACIRGEAFDAGYGRHPDCGATFPYMAALGHDFYLTRAGHGVGFADRDALPEDLRGRLDDACGWGRLFSEPEFDVSRGRLYVVR